MEGAFWEITFNETSAALQNGLYLIFAQDEFCGFRKLGYQIDDFCDLNCDLDDIWDNLYKHAFDIIGKIGMIVDIIKKKPCTSSLEDMTEAANVLGEAIGAIS